MNKNIKSPDSAHVALHRKLLDGLVYRLKTNSSEEIKAILLVQIDAQRKKLDRVIAHEKNAIRNDA